MRISDWSSDVCSSDLLVVEEHEAVATRLLGRVHGGVGIAQEAGDVVARGEGQADAAGEEHRALGLDDAHPHGPQHVAAHRGSGGLVRSEERRVGKGGGSTCRSRWLTYP